MPHPVLSYLNSYGRGRDGISEAEPNLRVVSAGLLSLLAVLWLKDGLLLFLGRVRRRLHRQHAHDACGTHMPC